MPKSELEVFPYEQGESKRRYLYLGHVFRMVVDEYVPRHKKRILHFYQ